MGDPKWFSWAHIIDSNNKRASWWARYSAALATSISLLSLLVAAGSAWYAREKLIEEQRPILEIIEGMKGDTTLLIKNSGHSTAFMVRNELWCELGHPVGGSKGPLFKVDLRTSTGQMASPDIPTGGTFETGVVVPWKGVFRDFDAHYTDGIALRLTGVLHYQDEHRNPFELPWCYVSPNPQNEKAGFFPCWYWESNLWR